MMRRGDGGVHFQMAQAVAIRCFACEEGGLGAGSALLNKTARRSAQFIAISVADLFVGHRSAGRPGLDFAAVGQASDSGSGRT